MSRAEKMTPAKRVTSMLIERMEQGVRPWAPSWTGPNIHRPLRSCGRPYRGLNRILLRAASVSRGWESPYFLTFNAAIAAGGHVRKGEKGNLVVFSGHANPRRAPTGSSPPAGEVDQLFGDEPQPNEHRQHGSSSTAGKPRGHWIQSVHHVFNASQIEDLPPRYFPDPAPPPRPVSERLEEYLAWVRATGAEVRHEGVQPCYLPAQDVILMPERSRFATDDLYAATLSHELGHYTASPHRLNRDFGSRFNDQARAVEEMVAECTAALLGSVFGHSIDHLDDHASYLAAWLAILRRDERAIFTIAAKAEAAADWLLRRGGRADLAELLTGTSEEIPEEQPRLAA